MICTEQPGLGDTKKVFATLWALSGGINPEMAVFPGNQVRIFHKFLTRG